MENIVTSFFGFTRIKLDLDRYVKTVTILVKFCKLAIYKIETKGAFKNLFKLYVL